MTSQNKKFFKGEFYRLLIAAAVLCCASAAPGVEAGGEVRYLAAAGDDAADGKTPATAWRTIERANAALPAGATLRLKCGDAFYGGLMLPSGPDAAHPTVLTSWGEGPKPVISATKNLKPDPSGWQDLTHCRWRISLANPSNFTGIATDDCNPGFLFVDGEVKGWKRFCHADLVSPWDFCGEDGWLYVHAERNPATLAKDIRVALRVPCVLFGAGRSLRDTRRRCGFASATESNSVAMRRTSSSSAAPSAAFTTSASRCRDTRRRAGGTSIAAIAR